MVADCAAYNSPLYVAQAASLRRPTGWQPVVHADQPHRKETLMTYYYYKDNKGEWRWYLQAANGNKLADSGEGYKNEQDCLAGIESVKKSGSAPVKKK